MLKVRGENYISRVVDNAFEKAALMATTIDNRDGFKMVLKQSCTNVCFMYIPPSMRNQNEDGEWQKKVDQVSNNICSKKWTNTFLFLSNITPLSW